MKAPLCIAALWLLSGCETISNFADDVGSHMPVVGERCEHWQCFTEEGKAQSRINQMMKQQQQQPQGQLQMPPPKMDTDPETNPYDNYHP